MSARQGSIFAIGKLPPSNKPLLNPTPNPANLARSLSIQRPGLVTRLLYGVQASIHISRRFFVPVVLCHGSCAWGAFVRAGFLEFRLTNLRTVATQRLVTSVAAPSL